MTKPLAQTSRDLLLDLHGRLPSIEGTLTALLGQRREDLEDSERATATINMLAGTVERLLKEKDTLMRMLGQMTAQRLGASDRRAAAIQLDSRTDTITLFGVKYSLGVLETLGIARIGELFKLLNREDGVITIKTYGPDL